VPAIVRAALSRASAAAPDHATATLPAIVSKPAPARRGSEVRRLRPTNDLLGRRRSYGSPLPIGRPKRWAFWPDNMARWPF
jgi:hypothetical protein